MIGIGSDKNIFKHVFKDIVKKNQKIFSGGTLHTSDARQACSTDSKIALRVSGISIKHETTWNTPGLDSRNVWQSHSYFNKTWNHLKYSWFGFKKSWTKPFIFSIKHETARKILGLYSRGLDKATHIFRERVLVLQIIMRGLPTPGITKTYRFFFTGPPWKWLSARP